MDVRLTARQTTYLYDKVQVLKVNKGAPTYTDIGNGLHFSWHGKKTIVVGEDASTKRHRHFICNITGAFAITFKPDVGGLPVSLINITTLTDKVSAALKSRVKELITRDPAFNELGRSGQKLEFHKNRIVNRHDQRLALFPPRPGHQTR